MVRYRYAKVNAYDFVSAWIYHLVVNALGKEELPRETLIAGKDAFWRFESVENGAELLVGILNSYLSGLSLPLRFFPKTSMAYAEHRIEKQKTEYEALVAAQKIWEGNDYKEDSGESNDAYYRCCFESQEALNREFQETSLEIFGPLLICRKKVGE
jgi:exodeoxyribonuclease V gamma subunit